MRGSAEICSQVGAKRRAQVGAKHRAQVGAQHRAQIGAKRGWQELKSGRKSGGLEGGGDDD